MTLPCFTNDGILPPGDYALSLPQLKESMLVLGPGDPCHHPHWDAVWRLTLVERLEVLVGQLWHVGITDIFVDGSFVEDKDHPNDIDGYFECDLADFSSGRIANELNRIDPHKCWTWGESSRRTYRGYPKKQLPMWHSYRVELYPHYRGAIAARDAHGNPLEFPSFFRTCRRTGDPKGIVRITQHEEEAA